MDGSVTQITLILATKQSTSNTIYFGEHHTWTNIIYLFIKLEAKYSEWIEIREKSLESNQLVDLVKKCLKLKSKLRPDKSELVHHDFFDPTCEAE